MVQQYTKAIEARIQAMYDDYDELLRQEKRFSLHELLSTPDFDIDVFSRTLCPNPFAQDAEIIAERFAEHYGIWLTANGEHYNTMTAYLHPNTVDAERLAIMGKFYALLYYIDDELGRERIGNLSESERQAAYVTARNLQQILETGALRSDPSGLEAAISHLLHEFAAYSSRAWLKAFVDLTLGHLKPAINDHNAQTRGEFLNIEEYVALRKHISGMYLSIALMEFGRTSYLDWDTFEAIGIAKILHQLREICAAIGALMNDIFSFEKECITNESDFNLVSLCMLNHPGWTLARSIRYAADIVRDMVSEFQELTEFIQRRCWKLHDDHPEAVEQVLDHVDDLIGAVQATWLWQKDTMRYKRECSIFEENHFRD